MLGIAIYNNRINYIKSKHSRNEVSITHHGVIRYDSFNKIIKNSIIDISKKENINEHNISIVIDSQFCSFNELFFEDENLEFHKNLSGSSKLSNHLDSYYYPINTRDDHYIGVHIDKSLIQSLHNVAKDNNYSINSIGVGLFSSEILARDVFNAKTLDNYLILRFITNNSIEILYINDGILMVYGHYKILSGKIIPIKVIGNVREEEKVKESLDKIIIKGNLKVSKIEKIFVYQSKGQSSTIKNLIKKNKSYNNIIPLNIFNYDNSQSKEATISNAIQKISYAELGQIFRGINV